LFLLYFLVGEGLSNLLCFLSTDGHHSEIVFDGILSNILHHIANLDVICEVDENAAHESTGALVNIDADILGGAVLVEGLPDVLIGKVTIYVLYVQTGEVLQL